ncbi:hypothetical protein [Paludibacterium paludis]|uniref:Uncharacterized protein n=1 Tax=Paludibacterium paludis TaxID=1225769 RepID=A0A918UAI4_9NEIS|nr:hypothetical protein [Paludibacterium paludis]GGY17533.1 hypothetical protein GCM10011289_21240 [Paludibacterium paludis]
MQFDEVLPQHFITLSRDPYPHILIDTALLQLAGGGAEASQFRLQVLAAAGWRHHAVTPLAKYPAEASVVYNRIRGVLAVTQDPQAILDELAKG